MRALAKTCFTMSLKFILVAQSYRSESVENYRFVILAVVHHPVQRYVGYRSRKACRFVFVVVVRFCFQMVQKRRVDVIEIDIFQMSFANEFQSLFMFFYITDDPFYYILVIFDRARAVYLFR